MDATGLTETALRSLADGARKQIAEGRAELKGLARHIGGASDPAHRDYAAVLSRRAAQIDAILCELWRTFNFPDGYALAAVGGYGRGELYPGSDIDLLFILDESLASEEHPLLEKLVSLLWDIGLEIGHSTRTVTECVIEAGKDITVQTSLLEARLLIGDASLFAKFNRCFLALLDPVAFCKAKLLEQTERYAKFNDTPYSLEPNCKESPGGLRDLQVILWVARAAGLGDTWRSLVDARLITRAEAAQLQRAERRLRDLRVELHLLTGRREDRLLFDHQEKLARAFGIEAKEGRRASEMLMQHYYKNAKRVTLLNSLVMQALMDRLVPVTVDAAAIIDEHFQLAGDRLDIRNEDCFEQTPRTILECFLLQTCRREINGLTPRMQRALWQARSRIDASFRREPAHRRLFLQIFQQEHVLRTLRQMNQYDVLARYLPAWGRIVGQMQHDLFHVYTVDQHILQVLRNLRRFAMPEFAHEYPFCSRLMNGFERSWLLYVAALFHDIAKGRGGDHSQLGMADAQAFCNDHEIGGEDAELIVFLVEKHLYMSHVAQKQDLTDPDVVKAFADTIGSQRRLTALYLLTVADIRGTSPKVWTTWKGKLLEDLFRMSAKLLSGNAQTESGGVAERQDEARRLLRYRGLRVNVERPLWDQLDTSYFMRHDADEIAWHTRTLYYRPSPPEPVVKARMSPIGEGLQVMVYVPDQKLLFARLCGFFARQGYTIADAKIHTTRHAYALDSFAIFASGPVESYRDVISLIEHDLTEQLETQPPLPAAMTGRLSRQVKHFPITPHIDIRADERGRQHVMSITAADRPGLLYAIARILGEHGISLYSAKIATLGERAEDVFLISGEELMHTASLIRLEQDLLAALQV